MKYNLLSLIIVSLLSCTKEVKIDIPQHQAKAVVNCFFTPDSIFKVDIKKSVSIFDSFSAPIETAEVSLYKNDFLVETLVFDDGNYISNSITEEMSTYTVKANFSDLDGIEAKSYVPTSPNLINYDFKGVFSSSANGWTIDYMQILVEDDALIDNYYEIVLERAYSITENCGEGYIIDRAELSDINDPVFMNEANNPHVFTDELFNGETYSFDIKFGRNECVPENYSLTLILRSITKEYYEYKKYLAKHQDTQESDIWNGFAEPIQMISNIKGGLGIFTGYSEVRVDIK